MNLKWQIPPQANIIYTEVTTADEVPSEGWSFGGRGSEYEAESLVKRRRPLASDKASVDSSLTVEGQRELALVTAHNSPQCKRCFVLMLCEKYVR